MVIGVYDSGKGGEILVDAINQKQTGHKVIFFEDKSALPLGNKSEVEILNFVTQGIDDLLAQGATKVFLACNTASVIFLKHKTVLSKYQGKVFGISSVLIDHLAQKKVDLFAKKGLVLATRATIESNIYQNFLLKEEIVEIEFYGSKDLAYNIQENYFDCVIEELQKISQQYQGVEYIVIGCTHYSLVVDQIKLFFGQHIDIIDPKDDLLAKVLIEVGF